MSKIYLTTAIPYVNGAPHIGHPLDYLLADFYARYRRLHGDEVRLQAGTDEHGSKVYKKAAAEGKDVQTFVDEKSQQFQDFIKKLGVEYTDFIRTTDPRHEELVQKVWQKLSPHIYKDTYHGKYCEGCERFVTDKECEENAGLCPDHLAEYQELSEENYYFRLSDFKAEVKAAIESGDLVILPEFRKKEVLKLIEDAPDVSISRPKEHLPWGVPVPDDDGQVMYVWLDALSNYITVLGYPEQNISDYWPATAQFVGKDILRFHAILWPAMLLALGLPLPKTILSHGFVLNNGQKMSKSLGNVVDPFEALERHGLDAFRYYFSRHIDTFMDSDFTWEKFDEAYNNELANDLGNIVQRLATLCQKNDIYGLVFNPQPESTYEKLMDEFEFTKAIDYAWEKLQDLNRNINDTAPWAVAKEDPARAKEILIELCHQLLAANHLLKPFLPIAAQIEQIFLSDSIVPPTTPLFPKDRS
ncbi:methionine--tRNA ligase [Candidatus Saccharibacteria bacterium]|nr:methionine--tRNA ligase [Candidatus Saccharibacteria bacterium]